MHWTGDGKHRVFVYPDGRPFPDSEGVRDFLAVELPDYEFLGPADGENHPTGDYEIVWLIVGQQVTLEPYQAGMFRVRPRRGTAPADLAGVHAEA